MHVYNIGCDSITETNEDQFFIRECGMHVQECPVVRPEGYMSCHERQQRRTDEEGTYTTSKVPGHV